MLPFVMRLLIEINEKMGCRFLIVDAKREAIHFYKKFGFDVLKDRKKGTLPMFFDMIKIIQYFRENKTQIEVKKIKEK